MATNLDQELTNLSRLTVDQLRARFAEVHGEPTNARHKEWLVKRIAWRIQAAAEGGLSDRARARAAQLANDADLRTTLPRTRRTSTNAHGGIRVAMLPVRHDRSLPMPGAVITRIYKGAQLTVRVLLDGFEYDGAVYRSLSAVAKEITGSHCNGYLFFGLTGGKK